VPFFLDRDGVLNRAIVRDGKPYPPASPAELEIVEGAAAGLARLKDLDSCCWLVTNQPDVARGTQTIEAVRAIHDAMRSKRCRSTSFSSVRMTTGMACLCRKAGADWCWRRNSDTASTSHRLVPGGATAEISDAGTRPAAARSFSTRTICERDRRPHRMPVSHLFQDAVDWIVRNSE